jgi:ABC-2 type transport system ATP-binding protein
MAPVIHVRNIRKTYGRTVAVDDVSFDVQPGEIFGLIGPNGAGKTTTMECVEGLRTPDRGTISVLSLDPVRDARTLQHRVGVQLQQAQLQKRVKVWEAVDLWAALYPRALNGDLLLDRLGLTDKRNAWFMTLSGGQKQRLFIALALIHDPEVVLLDELTTGLDPQARRAIWEMVRGIRERGKTVLLTTHLMEEAERLCDRVAIIEKGRVIDIGTPAGLVRKYCPEQTVALVTEDPAARERFEAIRGVDTVTVGPVLSAFAKATADPRSSQSGGWSDRPESPNVRYTIRGRSDELVTDIIQCLSEHRIKVTEFRTELPNLEDVFLHLTGHSIRD